MDRRDLGFGGCNGYGSFRVCFFDLSENTLHHRMVLSVFILEDPDKLLGPHIIGKGPQSFPGTT